MRECTCGHREGMHYDTSPRKCAYPIGTSPRNTPIYCSCTAFSLRRSTLADDYEARGIALRDAWVER